MGLPNEVYVYLNDLEDEYGNRWERIPETDERLLKVRLLMNIRIPKRRRPRTVWTDEMDTYLIENTDKTAKELGDYFGIDHQIVTRRRKKLGIAKTYKKK